MTTRSPLCRLSLLLSLALTLLIGSAAAQQPINADLITRGTLAPARIADSSLPSAKLGGDITAYARTLLQSIDAAAARNALVLGNVNNTSDASKPVSTAQAAADNAARDAAIAAAASDATAKADAAKARASHTGSQLASTISDFASASRAQAEAALIAGSNISITPAGTGATRTLTIASTAAGVTDGDKGDLAVTGTGSVWTIKNGAVNTARLGGDIVAFGRSFLQAVDATAARAVLGLGGAATLSVGTTAGTVAAGNDARFTDARVPTDGSVTDARVAAGAAIAESKLALASDAAAGTASRRTLGTGALQAAAGNDARLSDARVPTDGSVTDAKVAAGAAIAESKLSLASDAAAGTASRRTLGTGALQAAAGNDARLSDTRVPTDGSVTDAKVAAGAAIAESKLALASDAAAGTASRRTLGTGALQAAAGNDARLSDQRVPTDGSVTTTKLSSSLLTAFNGKLGAAETGGATLAFGAVPDGSYLRRSGTSLVGDPAGAVSAFKLPSRTGSETDRPAASGNAGRAIRLVNLGTGAGYARSIWQESDGSTWGNVNGVATFYSDWTPGSPITLPDTTQQAIGPTITVPAGLLGPKSQIRILPHVRASAAQSGNALRVFLGGQILYLSGGGWFESTPRVVVTNAGSTGAQTRNGIGNNSTGWGGSSSSTYSTQLALDTTTDLNITFTVTGVAADTMTFMGVTVEVVNP